MTRIVNGIHDDEANTWAVIALAIALDRLGGELIVNPSEFEAIRSRLGGLMIKSLGNGDVRVALEAMPSQRQ